MKKRIRYEFSLLSFFLTNFCKILKQEKVKDGPDSELTILVKPNNRLVYIIMKRLLRKFPLSSFYYGENLLGIYIENLDISNWLQVV
jgi:hypothetical protein